MATRQTTTSCLENAAVLHSLGFCNYGIAPNLTTTVLLKVREELGVWQLIKPR